MTRRALKHAARMLWENISTFRRRHDAILRIEEWCLRELRTRAWLKLRGTI